MPITDTVLSTWSEIHSYAQRSWIYRGQRSAEWELVTSLERCCDREEVVASDRLRLEKELRRDFQRVYHHYAQHIPGQESLIEWTSLMQHHGAPTRLLDFSYSIYVAAYFALENSDGDCAVWGVSAPWALRESVSLLLQAGKQQATTF
ncbi:MAG: FRG domain-containing protein, partial [Thermoanaerobaculia bacterium]